MALVLDGGVPVRAGRAESRDIASFLVDPRALSDQLARGSEVGPTLGKAARDLGLNQSSLTAAIAAGLLETRREGGLIRIRLSEIERFPMAWATLPELKRAMGAAIYPPVIAALSAAGVAPAASGRRQYDAIYPREAAMRACIAAAGHHAAPAEPGGRHAAVARDLRIPQGMMHQLIEGGLIAMQEGCRFGSIAAAEAARFKAAYVSPSELAETFKIRWPRAVVGKLAKAGVRPVCCPPAFQHHLYPRPDAEKALRSAVRAAARDKAALRARADDAPALSLREVATKFDTGPNMVCQLIHKGLLTPLHPVRPGRRTLVTVSEADRFARTYVFANELGRLAGREKRHGTARTVTYLLLKNGLRPVCSTPEFERFLFERQEAEALIRRIGLP